MNSNKTTQVPFIEKMFNLRSEIDTIVRGKANDYHNSSYFDINDVLKMLNPLLIRNKLLLTQPIKGNKVYTILRDTELNPDGEYDQEDSFLELPADMNPQKIGSAITYYRRYTLTSLLSLQADDDDGNAAIPKDQQKKPPTRRQQPRVPTQQKPAVKQVQPRANPKKKPTQWLDLFDPKTGEYTNAYYQLLIAMSDHPNQVTYESVLSKWKVNNRDKQILLGLFNPTDTRKP